MKILLALLSVSCATVSQLQPADKVSVSDTLINGFYKGKAFTVKDVTTSLITGQKMYNICQVENKSICFSVLAKDLLKMP